MNELSEVSCPRLTKLDLAVFNRHVLMAETDLGETVRSFSAGVCEE